jgi:hypothetical protein
LNNDQSSGDDLDDDDDAAVVKGKPIRFGTSPPPSFTSEARAFLVVEIASGTVKQRLVSASERMSMLFERDLAV